MELRVGPPGPAGSSGQPHGTRGLGLSSCEKSVLARWIPRHMSYPGPGISQMWAGLVTLTHTCLRVVPF